MPTLKYHVGTGSPRMYSVHKPVTTVGKAPGNDVVINGEVVQPTHVQISFDGRDFIIAEGGVMEGGKILRVTRDGIITPLLEGLPSFGDHHTNGPVVGSDGFVYFSQGTATNALMTTL